MTLEQLLVNIASVPAEKRRVTPLPQDWLIEHQAMLSLVDAGILGMDGFKYQFVEYAKDCARRCNIGWRKFS